MIGRLMKMMLAALALSSTLAIAADKPLVIESAKVKQLPPATTLQVNASGTGAASINIPHGTAPSAPVNGDCWTTTAGLYCRINGTTVGPYIATGGTTTNALTINSSGGASPGTTFDGSAARTIDYSTVGAAKTGAVTGSGLTMSTARLLGRSTAVTGAIEEISVGSGLSLSSGTLTATGGGGGGVTDNLSLDDGAMLILAVDQGTGAQGLGVNPTATGVLNRVPALTNSYTQQKKLAVGVNVGGTNQFGQIRGNTAILTGQVGWKFKARFGVGNTLANGRIVVGPQQGWNGATDPSAATNLFVVGKDSADSNLQLIYNDGSGSASKIDLGVNFPATTASVDFYDVELTMAVGGASATYKVTRVNTGNVATGTVITDLPATTTLLFWGVWFATGATNGTYLGDFMWIWAKQGA